MCDLQSLARCLVLLYTIKTQRRLLILSSVSVLLLGDSVAGLWLVLFLGIGGFFLKLEDVLLWAPIYWKTDLTLGGTLLLSAEIALGLLVSTYCNHSPLLEAN